MAYRTVLAPGAAWPPYTPPPPPAPKSNYRASPYSELVREFAVSNPGCLVKDIAKALDLNWHAVNPVIVYGCKKGWYRKDGKKIYAQTGTT